MALLIVAKSETGWKATGGLFDWTLEFIVARLSDKEAAERIQEIVDHNLGSLWIDEFPAQTQRELVSHLRDGLVAAAQRELPESDHKSTSLQHLHDLVDLTYQLDTRLVGSPTSSQLH